MPLAAPFAEPVPRDVPMYYDIIRRPMDLGTALTKLQTGKYGSPADLFADVNLVWANCRKYNEPDSEIAIAAEELEAAWRTCCSQSELNQLAAAEGVAVDTRGRGGGERGAGEADQYAAVPPPQMSQQQLLQQQQQQQQVEYQQQQRMMQQQQHAQRQQELQRQQQQQQLLRQQQMQHQQQHMGGAGAPAQPQAPGQQAQQSQQNAAQMQAMAAVVNKLRSYDVAAPFLEPVPREVPGYYEQIKHPIDLGTIWRGMAAGQYPTASHVHVDMQRMFQNCYAYNVEGSDVYTCAQQTAALYRRLCQEAGLM